MEIMAIDASTKSTGIAIFKDSNLIYYTCITASSTDLINRISKMVKEIKEILEQHNIEKIILEEVRPETASGNTKNIKTQKALMWLQAALNFMVHDNFKKISIDYVYPNSWRKDCGIATGRGIKRESLKKADINFVKQKYGIEVNDDIADAVCIGHAYVNKQPDDYDWA